MATKRIAPTPKVIPLPIPEGQPETVREALQNYRYEISATVDPILEMSANLISRFDGNNEGDFTDERAREEILPGLARTLNLCGEFVRRRTEEVDSAYMDKLPAGNPES